MRDFTSNFEYPISYPEYEKEEDVKFLDEKKWMSDRDEFEREEEEKLLEEYPKALYLGKKSKFEERSKRKKFEDRYKKEVFESILEKRLINKSLSNMDIIGEYPERYEKPLVTREETTLSKAVIVEEDVGGKRGRIKIGISLDKLRPRSFHIFYYKDKEVAVQMLPDGKIEFFEVITE